jgi:hypothetical protein
MAKKRIVQDFTQMKQSGEKIVYLTVYLYPLCSPYPIPPEEAVRFTDMLHKERFNLDDPRI